MRRRMTYDPSMPEGHCGVCRRALGPSEARMVVGSPPGQEETMVSVIICRSCLSEHIPEILRASESAGIAEDDFHEEDA